MAADHKDGDFQFQLESQNSSNQNATKGTMIVERQWYNDYPCGSCRYYNAGYCNKFKVSAGSTDYASYPESGQSCFREKTSTMFTNKPERVIL